MKINLEIIGKSMAATTLMALIVSPFGLVATQFVNVASAEVPPVTTNSATAITMTDATLNGALGDIDATGHSFWVSTSTFSTAIPSTPAGVYTTADLGAAASSTAFSSSVTAAVGLPTITPNTTYYFAAWADIGGVWTPGEVSTFTTLPLPSTDSTLSNLTISAGTLSPVFSASTTAYTDNVDNSVSSVTVTPTSNDVNATISVNGNPVVSGSASLPIAISVGTNPSILTIATAQDGIATSTYTITVTRAAAEGAPFVTTNSATGASSTDALLNGTNGTSDASGHSFWVSTSTFSTVSPTIPAGVYSTVDLGAIASSTAFSALLSSAVGVPTITPSTTYYFAAWSNVDGTWYPGDIHTFTTEPSTTGGDIGGDVTGGVSTSTNGILKVDGVTAEKTTAVADGTFASGWKYVFNITVPSNETHLSMKFADWTSLVGSTTLAAANNMRISSLQADNSGATVLVTAADTYTTPTLNMITDLNPTTNGKQVQVTIEVAVPSTTVNGSYTTNYGVKTQ